MSSLLLRQQPTSTSPPASTSQNQCYAPGAGFYTNPSTKCAAQCAAGTYSTSGSASSCSSCSANQIAPAGATATSQCTTCGTGSAPQHCEISLYRYFPSRSQEEGPRTALLTRSRPLSRHARREKDDTRMRRCSLRYQSCGGCPGENVNCNGGGIDCTAFDSRATATCQNGKCEYECPVGMEDYIAWMCGGFEIMLET